MGVTEAAQINEFFFGNNSVQSLSISGHVNSNSLSLSCNYSTMASSSYHNFVSANLTKKVFEISPVKNPRLFRTTEGYVSEVLEITEAFDVVLVDEYKRLQDPVIQPGNGILFKVKVQLAHSTDWCKQSLTCDLTVNTEEELKEKKIREGPVHIQAYVSVIPVYLEREEQPKNLMLLRRYWRLFLAKNLEIQNPYRPPHTTRSRPKIILETRIVSKSYV